MKKRSTTPKRLLGEQMKDAAFRKAYAAEELPGRQAIRNARLWAEEAQARNRALRSGLLMSRPANAVLKSAQSRLRRIRKDGIQGHP